MKCKFAANNKGLADALEIIEKKLKDYKLDHKEIKKASLLPIKFSHENTN